MSGQPTGSEGAADYGNRDRGHGDASAGDAELKADFIERIHWTLTRMLRRGAVVGMGCRRGGDCHLPMLHQIPIIWDRSLSGRAQRFHSPVEDRRVASAARLFPFGRNIGPAAHLNPLLGSSGQDAAFNQRNPLYGCCQLTPEGRPGAGPAYISRGTLRHWMMFALCLYGVLGLIASLIWG